MRFRRLAAVCLTVGLAAAPAMAAQKAPSHAKTTTKSSSVATHSMKGVVKSVDQNTLVIESGKGKEMKNTSFALDSMTHRGGDIKAGDTVAVRYKAEGSKLMATSIEEVKQAKKT